MSLFQKFLLLLGYIFLVIMVTTLLTVGGALTIIAVLVSIITYYPITLVDYLLNKFKKL